MRIAGPAFAHLHLVDARQPVLDRILDGDDVAVRLVEVLSVAYSVVDFPEPVGPVTRIVPYGLRYAVANRSSVSGRKPRSSSRSSACPLSRIRMTTFSPCTIGSVATRRSTLRPPTFSEMRPSCGMRRSAMLISAMTLSRLITPAWIERGERITSWSTPSMRNRMRRSCSVGSTWMSDARSLTACVMSRLTNLTIGASSMTSLTLLRSSFSEYSSAAACATVSTSASTRKYRSIVAGQLGRARDDRLVRASDGPGYQPR